MVDYESGPSLAGCVEALRRERPAEVVVVDNGSHDGSVDGLRLTIPGVAVVDPGANLGYGAAANRGVAATSAPIVLVCNSDLEVQPGRHRRPGARRWTHEPGCGAGRTPDPRRKGRRYPSARRFPSQVDAAGHALLGLFFPDNPFTRPTSRPSWPRQRRDPRRSTGSPGPASWSGAPPSRRSGDSTSRTSCTPRTSTCAGGWAGPGGRVAYVPAAEVTHLQGVSTEPPSLPDDPGAPPLAAPVRRPVVGRVAQVLLPMVAVGLGVRAGLAFLARRHPPVTAPGVPDGQAVGCRSVMASNSTGKWVQRAATTGGGRTYRGQMPVNWYASLIIICVVGLLLVGLSRYQLTHRSASSAGPPTTPQTGTPAWASTSAEHSSRTSRPAPTRPRPVWWPTATAWSPSPRRTARSPVATPHWASSSPVQGPGADSTRLSVPGQGGRTPTATSARRGRPTPGSPVS